MAEQPRHDWYLREWFAQAGLKQADLTSRLDYQKGTAFNLWHSVQPYRRDHVEAISELLHIKPHELLMHPDEAMRIRRLESAIAEVAKAQPAAAAEPAALRTGTKV